MKNKDKYKQFLAEVRGNICSSDAPWEEAVCRGKPCTGCIHRFLEWVDKDCVFISSVERAFLSNINDLYKYIGRDGVGDLWLFENEPRLDDGFFENNGGRFYKLPDFIAEEVNGVERESIHLISEL